MDPAALRRLRWRARRGLLENDLILARFLDREGMALSDAEAHTLGELLELPDTELLDLLLRRGEPAQAPPQVLAMLDRLRMA